MRDAFEKVGVSVWNGAFSTIVGMTPMGLCKSFMINLFWVMTTFVVFLGMWMGLVVVPILLSFVVIDDERKDGREKMKKDGREKMKLMREGENENENENEEGGVSTEMVIFGKCDRFGESSSNDI